MTTKWVYKICTINKVSGYTAKFYVTYYPYGAKHGCSFGTTSVNSSSNLTTQDVVINFGRRFGFPVLYNNQLYNMYGIINENAIKEAELEKARLADIVKQKELKKLLAEQAQLAAKRRYLADGTSEWASQEAYNNEVTETMLGIKTYNDKIQTLQSGQPVSRQPPAIGAHPRATGTGSQPAGLNPLIPAGLAVAGVAAYALTRGKS